MLCFAWIGTGDDWFTQRGDVAQTLVNNNTRLITFNKKVENYALESYQYFSFYNFQDNCM